MKTQIVAILAGAMLMMATSAMASPINGALWENVSFAGAVNGSDWLVLNFPKADPDATFEVNSINFSSNTPVTYDQWLKSPTWTSGESHKDGFSSGSDFMGTYFLFSGNANFSSTFSVTHDDGFWMDLFNDTTQYYYFDSSQNVSAMTESFDIVAGNYNFNILYSADNGFPEVLQIAGMSAPVPEPGTMMLLGIGMLGMAVYGKRRMNKEA